MNTLPAQSPRNGLAIAAFVFGLIAIPLAIFPFDMFPGPVAIVLGLLARRSPNLSSASLVLIGGTSVAASSE